jgi:hypothetical protein
MGRTGFYHKVQGYQALGATGTSAAGTSGATGTSEAEARPRAASFFAPGNAHLAAATGTSVATGTGRPRVASDFFALGNAAATGTIVATGTERARAACNLFAPDNAASGSKTSAGTSRARAACNFFAPDSAATGTTSRAFDFITPDAHSAVTEAAVGTLELQAGAGPRIQIHVVIDSFEQYS